jgi:hypothetical protein
MWPIRNPRATEMFVRFVAGTDSDNAFWLDGVIRVASDLSEDGELFEYEARWLNEVFEWFNENLPCPPFRKNFRSGNWTRNAKSWFHDRAGEPLRRIWDIVAVLQDHGTTVRLVVTDRPGKIVYADSYQIVAETPDWA